MKLPELGSQTEFDIWAGRWMTLARYQGAEVPTAEARIEDVLRLWDEPIPGEWRRGDVERLLRRDVRYTRRNLFTRRRGEHAIEHAMLVASLENASCLGKAIRDGVNAVPLVRDSAGARTGNVEADVLLLTGDEGSYRVFLVEIKVRSNNAWFAAVENLRQLKLFSESSAPQRIFHLRSRELKLPERIPVTALVLAPPTFFADRGQKSKAIAPAQELLRRISGKTDIPAHLATWAADERAIRLL